MNFKLLDKKISIPILIICFDRPDFLKKLLNVLKKYEINKKNIYISQDGYCGNDKFLIKTTITSLVEQLNVDEFWRVHRNCIVRVSQIAKVERDFSGYLFVYLKQTAKTGQPVRLHVSRSYQHLFKQM